MPPKSGSWPTKTPRTRWSSRGRQPPKMRLLAGTPPKSAGCWQCGWDGTIWTLGYHQQLDQRQGAMLSGNGDGDPTRKALCSQTPENSSGGIYVSTERNNDVSGTSRNSILRVDPTASGATLTATMEWNLTADLPVVGPNLGIEAITWISDSLLVSRGFADEAKRTPTRPPSTRAMARALVRRRGSHRHDLRLCARPHSPQLHPGRLIASGFPRVMALEFDRELNVLWTVCDGGCQGCAAILGIDPGTGKFAMPESSSGPPRCRT